jgi:uncharacterized protein
MSAQLQTVASGRRRLAALLFVPLLVVLAGCSTAAAPAAPAAPGAGSIDTPSRPASGALGAPDQGPGAVTVGSGPSGATGFAPTGATEVGPTGVAMSGGGVVSSGAGVGGSGVGVGGSVPAIAYPYPIYPGSPGVAPDHTIVVAGVGRADVKADLSDQAGAQRDALQAALADAKAQADVVARAAGVTITGVLSVSVSSGGAYAVPMASGAAGSTPGAVPGGAPNIAPAPVPLEPTVQQLVVSVTVAYRIS